MTAFGPCESAATGAAAYLSSQFVGLAFVKESDYLTNAGSAMVVDPDDSATNGYRDAAAEDDYAYPMTGGRYGDMSDKGGYLGIVSYLNTGTDDIKTKQASVYVSDDQNVDRVTDRDTGDYGAPLGPFDVCISEVDGDGNCGDERTFVPGEYKFSIFGYTKGANSPPVPGED